MAANAQKLLEPIKVGPIELKNRIMFPPLTTGYEERDGSIGERSLAFYERLAKGGVSYIVIGDVAPVMTASPTPKLASDVQIPSFAALADAVHKHGAKIALQLFHPEYDVPGVGRMIMGSMSAAKSAQAAKAAGDEETFAAKMAESEKIRQEAYAKLHHDMQHFVTEATVEQLNEIKEAIAASAARAEKAGIDVEGLLANVDEYNEMCDNGWDDIFEKEREFMRPLEKGPFYCCKQYCGAYGTLGGVLINHKMEVMTDDYEVIPGLYCVGTDACTIYGDSYNYCIPGNTMGFCLNSGRIAGENAASALFEDAGDEEWS